MPLKKVEVSSERSAKKLGGRPNLLSYTFHANVLAQMLLIQDGQWRLGQKQFSIICNMKFSICVLLLSPEIIFIISYTEHLLLSTDSRKGNTCNQKWVLMPNTCKCSKKPLDNET